MSSGKKLEDLDLTQDELSRLSKAFKDEEFKKLFCEYAQEISDPENRKKYEEEIAILENERGMDCQFVHPNPGHVIKSRLVDGETKAFFNICQNELVEEAKCSKETRPDGSSGLAWKIPHSFAPVKDDVDKNKNKCKVFDFVVHPNTYRMSQSNERFLKMIHDTALDSATKQFGFQFDKSYIRKPKMKFKGASVPTVIRTKKSEGEEIKPHSQNDLLSKLPYPYDENTSAEKAKKLAEEVARKKKLNVEIKTDNNKTNSMTSDITDDGYHIPKYVVKHSSNLDLQQFTNSRDSSLSTRPTELVIEIDLPGVKSVSSIDLDIFQKKLKLVGETPVKYMLEIDLPYEVDENKGNAKFEKPNHKLVVKLPVVSNKTIDNKCVDIVKNELPSEAKECFDDLSATNPLIEVLSENENLHRDQVDQEVAGNCSPITDSEQMQPDLSKRAAEFSSISEPRRFYTLPTFHYHQDNETVNIVLNIKNSSRASLVKNFYFEDNACKGLEVKLVSVGSGGFPMHYCFCIQFSDKDRIDNQQSYVDLNDDNVVITCAKIDQSLGLWEQFRAGLTVDSLEDIFFLTQHNVKEKLQKLDQEAKLGNGYMNRDGLLDLEVTDMNSQCLSVDIKEKKGGGHSFSESAEEIEVVHDLQSPKIPSILKQRGRTMSESSDDLFHSSNTTGSSLGRQQSTGGESSPSPLTEESENETSDEQNSNGRKKSVSFSEHVDETTYKATQSVNSMKSTLKNKKKKARKREQKTVEKEKRQHRRRRNSNSLSEPSSDEYSQQNSENGGFDADPAESSSKRGEAAMKKMSKECNGENSLENISVIEGENGTDCNGSILNEVHSETKVIENGEIVNGRTKTDSDDGDESDEDVNGGKEVTSNKAYNQEDTVTKPDTLLSWDETTIKPAAAIIGEDGDGSTDGAFAFTNKMIYELDVD